MTLDYKIRNFEVEDSVQVIELLKGCGLCHEPWDNRENYEEKKKRDPDLMLVAEANSNVVGFVLGQYDGWGPMIWRLTVKEDYRNKSVGTKLLEEITARLKARGAKSIYALVGDKNEYKNWWEKQGWYFDTKCWTIGLED